MAAQSLAELGIHKQHVNRLLEPFAWVEEVVTATEWQNFFSLRTDGNADPAIQAIATGLGFLGAGIVFRDREEDRTRGLTTAASLLVVAPVGIAVALEHYALAVGSAVLLTLVLGAAQRIDRHIRPDHA